MSLIKIRDLAGTYDSIRSALSGIQAVQGVLLLCALGLALPCCAPEATAVGGDAGTEHPDLVPTLLNHSLVPMGTGQSSEISTLLPRGWEQLITYSNGSKAWQPSADCSALGTSLCRPQVLLPPADGQYVKVYSVSVDVHPGDIIRVAGQAEFTEQEGLANTIDVYLSVDDGFASKAISATATQVVTRQDNHHMPIPLSGSYVVPSTGADLTLVFSLMARKRGASGVLIESTQCQKCGYLLSELYRSDPDGANLALKELYYQSTSLDGSTTPPPVTPVGSIYPLLFPSLAVGDVLSTQTSTVNQFSAGKPDLVSNVLYIPGSGGIVSSSSENISTQLPLTTLWNRSLLKIGAVLMNYPVSLKVTSGNSSFGLTGWALAGLQFGKPGKQMVRVNLTSGADATWSHDQEQVLMESRIEVNSGDILRIESNVTLDQPSTIPMSSSCQISTRVLDGQGTILHESIRCGRILSPLYPFAHYLPFDATGIQSSVRGVNVQTVAQCDSMVRHHLSAGAATQQVDVFR